jgi:uncharacterized protein
VVAGAEAGSREQRREKVDRILYEVRLLNCSLRNAIMKWRRIRRWFVICASVSLVIFVVISWYLGAMLVVSANHSVGDAPNDPPFISTTFASESGTTIAGWYASSKDSRATIILLHAIRADRRSMVTRAKLFFDAGYSVLLIDMQAHGESPGRNVTAGYLERHDVRAAVDFVKEKNPTHKIGIVGCSLGGAATLLASPLKVDAIVLEAVYPTITEAINDRIAIRLGPLSGLLTPALTCQLYPRLGISTADLRPIDHIAEIGCPVLVAGGDLDKHTPPTETKRMYDTAIEPKSLVIFPGAVHEDLLAKDPQLYSKEIASFLNKYLRN